MFTKTLSKKKWPETEEVSPDNPPEDHAEDGASSGSDHSHQSSFVEFHSDAEVGESAGDRGFVASNDAVLEEGGRWTFE